MNMQSDLNKTTELIYKWFDDRDMHEPLIQYAKMIEEAGEIAHEITRGRMESDELLDAIGDTYVTLAGLAHHLGYDLSICAEAAYNVIKDRKGKVVNGSFVKEEQ